MKLTNTKMLTYLEQLRIFLQSNTDKNAKISFAVARNHRILEGELKEFLEKRTELIKKYGKEKDGGYTIEKEDKEALKAFAADIKEYEDIEVEVHLHMLDINILDNVSFTASEMMLIEFMFEQIKV